MAAALVVATPDTVLARNTSIWGGGVKKSSVFNEVKEER